MLKLFLSKSDRNDIFRTNVQEICNKYKIGRKSKEWRIAYRLEREKQKYKPE